MPKYQNKYKVHHNKKERLARPLDKKIKRNKKRKEKKSQSQKQRRKDTTSCTMLLLLERERKERKERWMIRPMSGSRNTYWRWEWGDKNTCLLLHTFFLLLATPTYFDLDPFSTNNKNWIPLDTWWHWWWSGIVKRMRRKEGEEERVKRDLIKLRISR